MIAVSNPVVIWSPSGALLRRHAHITPQHFIQLVEDRYVRIILRDSWLNKNHREKHDFPEARWDDYIDDAIYRIHLIEQHEPDESTRRVIIAPDEKGKSWAQRVAREFPGEAEYWRTILHSADADQLISKGSLQAIRRNKMDTSAAIERILRDLHNHERAIKEANAEAPFLLNPDEVDRLRRSIEVDEAIRKADGETISQPEPSADRMEPAALAEGLMSVLERLEGFNAGVGLMKFVGTEQHAALISWYKGVAALLQGQRSMSPHDAELAILRNITSIIEHGQPQALRSLFTDPLRTAMTAVSTAGAGGSILALANGQWIEGLLGIGASAFLAGGALRKMRTNYSGEVWPYFFAFGHAPSAALKLQLLDRLAENSD